jgi:hypothetical protein
MVTKGAIILAEHTFLTCKVLANPVKIRIIPIKVLALLGIPTTVALFTILILQQAVSVLQQNKILNERILTNDLSPQPIIHSPAHHNNLPKVEMRLIRQIQTINHQIGTGAKTSDQNTAGGG